jgi:hypothetical protein
MIRGMMMSKTETVWLVGHKDSVKKKDYMAVCADEDEAKVLLAHMPGATFIKEVTFETR